MGGLSEDAWPVSPWPIPRAEGQEVARDPGRIQALLCLRVSNHYQMLHSNGRRAQAPLTWRTLLIIQLLLPAAVLCDFTFERCIHPVLSSGFRPMTSPDSKNKN